MTTFLNPVLGGDRPDPAVLKDGDEYWMTYSSFESSPGLPIYRSTDLVNWEYVTSALPDPLGSTFAVDIAKVDGTYFIYIPSVPAPWSDLDAPSIHVIHAPSMRGPWSEPIDLGIRMAIDPGHVVAEDGRRWLFVNGIRRIPLADDGLSTDGQLEPAYSGWAHPADWITEAYALEGPKFLWRDGWCYLVSAVGGTSGPATGHMVIVARSRSVDGPWENSPHNPVARTTSVDEAWWSRGHATLIEGPEKTWWMVSHGYRNGYRTLGRQILLEPIEWTEDGWPRAVASDLGATLDAPEGARPQSKSASFEDAMTAVRPGERWRFHAAAPVERDRISLSPAGLLLAGSGTGPGDSAPLALVTGDHAYAVEVSIEIEVDPVEAGLLLYFNDRLFCGMGIDGDRMISYAGGHPTHWREPVPATGSIRLRLENDHHVVTGRWRIGAGPWQQHGVRYETSGYHANTMGDLQSLRPAIYAAGGGAARFTDFRYEVLS